MRFISCFIWGVILLGLTLPAQATILVIDDGDAAGYTEVAGTWTEALKGSVQGDYRWANGSVGDPVVATYTPGAVAGFAAGTYDVYLSWGQSKYQSTDYSYTLNYAGSSESFTINGKQSAAQGETDTINPMAAGSPTGMGSGYRLLGTYAMDTLSNLTLSVEGGGTVDAIMLRSADEGKYLDQQSTSFTSNDTEWRLVSCPTAPSGNYDYAPDDVAPDTFGYWDLTSESGLYDLKISWAANQLHCGSVQYLVDLNGNGTEDAEDSLFVIDQQLMADQETSNDGAWSGYYDLGVYSLTDDSQIVQYRTDSLSFNMTAAATLVTSVVPEPATLTLLVSSLLGLLAFGWQRRK